MKTFARHTILPATLAFTALLALTPPAYAQGGVPIWTNYYDGPAHSNDYPHAVAVDASGNVVVTGGSLDSNGNFEYATTKYSGAGTPLWTNRYKGGLAVAVAVDGSDNVLVTGFSGGSAPSYATIKYSSAGVPLWTNRYKRTASTDDEATAMAVDGKGNVLVTGNSGHPLSPGSYDCATVAYSASGAPLWTNVYNGPGNSDDFPFSVAVDGNGNVFVAGVSYGANRTSPHYATVAYSAAGAPLWTNLWTTNGPVQIFGHAHAVAVDGEGNVLVTGESPAVGGNLDYATIKYSTAGVPLWASFYNGPGNGSDSAQALAVDTRGNVFVTGYSHLGPGATPGYATVAYSGAGVPLWTNRYSGSGDSSDYANAIAADGRGNVFVTGQAYVGGSPQDYATVAYSGAGVPLWTNRFNGPVYQDDQASIAVDHVGNVFVAGLSSSGASYDYATIKYSAAAPLPIPLSHQIVGDQVVLSWTGAAFGLQSAPAVQGTYTNIPFATSPYTNPITAPKQYFRLKAN